MAKTTGTYSPSAELMELVQRYLRGDRSVEETLRQAAAADSRFLTFLKRYKTEFGSRRWTNGTWSVGTNGSRVGGPNDDRELGGISKGVSQWNQQRNQRAGYGGSPSSPGGFKSSGRDEDSALRRSGQMTSDSVLRNIRFDENDNLVLGNRKYNKAQRDAILRRGMSGATMNWSDQAVYDALIASQKATKEREDSKRAELVAERERQRQIKELEQKRREDDDADLLKRRRDFADWRMKEDYKNAAEAEKDAKADESKRRDDDLKWKRENGFDYTDEQKRKYNKLTKLRLDVLSGSDGEGGFVDTTKRDAKGMTEQDRLLADIDRQMQNIKYNPVSTLEDRPTLQQRYDKDTIVDDRGVRRAQDENGKWYMVDNPKDNEFENRMFQREEDRRYKEQQRRDKYLESRIKHYETPKDDGKGGEIPGLTYEEALKQARKDMQMFFDEEVEQPQPDPVAQQPDPVAHPTDTVAQQPDPVAQSTDTGGGSYWGDLDTFLAGKGGQTDAPETAQSEAGTCPICGAPLASDENGDRHCPTCGWPNEFAYNNWLENNRNAEE